MYDDDTRQGATILTTVTIDQVRELADFIQDRIRPKVVDATGPRTDERRTAEALFDQVNSAAAALETYLLPSAADEDERLAAAKRVLSADAWDFLARTAQLWDDRPAYAEPIWMGTQEMELIALNAHAPAQTSA
ncbi:hypothetical protein P3T27_007500 [Kitasatospora sp. MAA19]|uniref:hypothetical protein n=1 Tax=Kitasatospora sp. MAA19 TaxID=3035090 RepID=UPI002476E4B3|nr:hypothetical protein [Kitasatospora sp. MAA19]MDH6710749.1 hypothetical protein [Kitasatospora sp. MAA19]